MLVLATLVVISGCFGGRGKSSEDAPADPPYQPKIVEESLYLRALTGAQRWELYPDVFVEAFAFSTDRDSEPTIPGPVIRAREGDTVRVTFELGSTPMAHTIHWHGVHVPWDQDGVPYLSQAPLGSETWGGNGTFTYTYEFVVNQSGTYWYHCHVDTQHHLDMGMYGALIIDPADPNVDPKADQDEILFFDEWDKSHIHTSPSTDPNEFIARSGQPEDSVDALYGQLRDYYQMGPLTTIEQVYERVRSDPNLPPAVKDLLDPGLVRENRTWYPFTYPAYYAEYDTFLINGKAFPDTTPILVENGKTLRMRFVNAGSLGHAIHLHGHHMLVTHKDGYLLQAPYYADTLSIVPGERYDVYVKLDNPGPWMLHDHMAQYEQNDNINPGGISTMLCYTSGWSQAQTCKADMHHMEGKPTLYAGDIIEDMTTYHRWESGLAANPAFRGHH